MTAVLGLAIFLMAFITPLIINPESLQSDFIIVQTLVLAGISCAIFYISLAGVNQRLIAEKDRLLKRVNGHIKTILDRIHQAFEAEDYRETKGLRDTLISLKEEKEMIEAVPTWPWRPSTFRGFVSAIGLPVIIWLIQEFLGQFI
jgi:hypothetical protein